MKPKIALLNLLALALLASCGSTSSSSASASSSNVSESSATSASTSSATSGATSSASAYDTEALKAAYGNFSITRGSNAGSFTYDEVNNVYTLSVDTTKAEYILTGYFEGQILIKNVNSLSSYKGVTITLTNACLVSTGDYPAIYYTLSSKNVEVKAKVDTSNKILALGTDVAIYSGNNIEFSGKGNLELASTGAECHAVRADDQIRFYSSPTIRVSSCAHDAFHGNECIFSEDPDVLADNPFEGTIYVDSTISQAFDFETSSGKGFINVYSGTVYANNCESVFKTDAALVIGANAKVIATNLTGDPYQQGDNSSGLAVTINGTFTNDGADVA